MDGSCQCGAVKFTTPTPSPSILYHCHCTDCRKQSASAFGTSAIFPFFKLSEGDAVSSFIRTCDSGNKQFCYFCSKCGTRLLHAQVVDGGEPKVVAVKGGVLEGIDWSKAWHIYCRSAVVSIPDGVQRFETGPTR
ncbi:hypothetical protein GQ43DRAFT_243100 [Delitschia confertaspora ATCC 74209]|uniref:CENP-V/GFA domain-containing protein n=1 Tax=Delitschia confertaspora ATCC 74209 TaxID=1513339 RepID=A0A9P4JCC0_9PLEO|nr:hypothetical protein GQ43DRAFT_243100 [Delitschia confertaspora ATCC 74209]